MKLLITGLGLIGVGLALILFTDLNPAIDKDKSSHSGMIRYGNEPLSLWGGCPGNTPPEWMLKEISFVIPGPRIGDPS